MDVIQALDEEYDLEVVYSLDELRRCIVPLANMRGIKSPRIFGSYARDEATGHSDIDLLVDKAGTKFLNICGLAGEVSEALHKPVDVYDESELANGPFKDTILREAVAL